MSYCLDYLASLSSLRDLDLTQCQIAATPAEHPMAIATLNSALLQLQQLTSLCLCEMGVDGSVLAGFSGMQRLQSLELITSGDDDDAIPPISLEVLPPNLTVLDLAVLMIIHIGCSAAARLQTL